jgi:hypothetical protein
MQLHKQKKSGGISQFFLFLVLGTFIAGGTYVALVFFEKSPPTLQISGSIENVGGIARISVVAGDDNSGLRSIALTIRQDGKEYILIDESFARKGYTGIMGPATFSKDISFNVEEAGIKDGPAELVVRVSDYSLRGYFSGNKEEVIKEVTIDTVPPKVRLLHAERYINSGGSGIVIYQLDGEAVRHGAEFGGSFHNGHPVGDGRDDVFIAYIALPYDSTDIGKAMIQAEDAAGNQGSLPFSTVFKKTVFRRDKITVGDGFLAVKIPEFEGYYPEMQGDMKDKYLFTNRVVRQANNEKIHDLCRKSVSQRLWDGRFQRMAGASRAGFADHRTYYYQGEEIDKQVHLGMDIASTERAEVRAANAGEVVFADYLGIYGNMVLLDHGQGVFSLYSHLSSIQVAVGDSAGTDTVLGLTGTTGMAGGDHLHFSMLVNGIFVTPKEWWDEQWIEVTIMEPLNDSKF